jgi:hypothetical protein
VQETTQEQMRHNKKFLLTRPKIHPIRKSNPRSQDATAPPGVLSVDTVVILRLRPLYSA